MKVQLFYFDGCPNHSVALERLKQILRQEGLPEHVEEMNVTSPEQAQALAFLGSPTIKINGVDVEPAARGSQAYAMACRTYRNAGKQQGQPDEEMIRAALREALGQPASDCCAPPATVAAKSSESKSSALVMAGSIFAAILASFCCILPIVFGLTGLTVVGASAAFAAWRPYLLTATFGLLAAGFYFAYRRPAKTECAPGSACAMPVTKRSGRVVLWLTTAAAMAFALFPYYSGPVAERLLPDKTAHAASPAPALQHASFRIEGMDCAACAVAVEGKLKSVAGVQTARISFEQKTAEVDFNPAIASPEQFCKAIEEAGFLAVKTNKGA
jgi:copper chaperone CopZ